MAAGVDELLADEGIDVVSVCTPTDTHVGLALRALAAGKHVLVEKPVALAAPDIEKLAEAAAAARRHCLPAMCMRFWPAWVWLHDRIRDGSLGAVRSAAFTRIGNPPGWGTDFYGDVARSGGALHDLHVHDADFVLWCFGLPEAVSSSGDALHVSTLYHYRDGPAPVSAEGAWIRAPSFPFRMRYAVEFTGGVAEFSLGAEPELLVHEGAAARGIELGGASAYNEEVLHFLRVVRGEAAPRMALEDAAAAARILDAEARSAADGGRRTAVRSDG
jgi:predicted dehydrogenase